MHIWIKLDLCVFTMEVRKFTVLHEQHTKTMSSNLFMMQLAAHLPAE
jgi:hypothetical protein